MFSITVQNDLIQEQLNKLLANGKLGLKLTRDTAQLFCLDNQISVLLPDQSMSLNSVPYGYCCKTTFDEISNSGELVLDNIRRMLTGGNVSYYSAYMIQEEPVKLQQSAVKNESCPEDIFDELLKINNFVVTFIKDERLGIVKIDRIMIPAMQIQRVIKVKDDETSIPVKIRAKIVILDKPVELEAVLLNQTTFNPGEEYICIYRVLINPESNAAS